MALGGTPVSGGMFPKNNELPSSDQLGRSSLRWPWVISSRVHHLPTRYRCVLENNPGIAVFSYATSGEIDPATFNILSFGTGTKQGQNLCLQNVNVAAGTTFLATASIATVQGCGSVFIQPSSSQRVAPIWPSW